MYIVFVLVSVALLFFVFLFAIYMKTFYQSAAKNRKKKFRYKGQAEEYGDRIKEVYDDLANREYEKVYICNRSKMRLAARYYHHKDGAPVAILFHGYKSKALFDSGGGYKILSSMGINVLLPDQRAHGDSEGKSISFGINERYDCLDWINYAVQRFGDQIEIILVGVSMGGATVLMSVDCMLPSNVKCIISDCAYSSPEKIIRKVIGDLKLPGFLYPFVRMAGRVYGGFDIHEMSALRSVEKAEIPILLIHGDNDGFVPYEMARELHGIGKSELMTVSGADHGLSYIVEPESYTATVSAFLERNLQYKSRRI